jgi:hypothetical protein
VDGDCAVSHTRQSTIGQAGRPALAAQGCSDMAAMGAGRRRTAMQHGLYVASMVVTMRHNLLGLMCEAVAMLMTEYTT